MPLLILSCSKDQQDDLVACASPLLDGTSICLDIAPSADLDPFRAQIEQLARQAMTGIRQLMPIDDLTIQNK